MCEPDLRDAVPLDYVNLHSSRIKKGGNVVSYKKLAAQKYVDMGLSIIPARQNKSPMVKWKPWQTARPDHDQVAAWWDKWPQANVAVVTGEISHLTVIDVDTKDAWELIKQMIPKGTVTPVASTPNGGKHVFFQVVKGLSSRNHFMPGCDLRSNGGILLLPPSVGLNERPYSWMWGWSLGNTPLAQMPKELKGVM